MFKIIFPKEEYLSDYQQWNKVQGKSMSTIKGYTSTLQSLINNCTAETLLECISQLKPSTKHGKISALRDYMKYLRQKGDITRDQLEDFKEIFKIVPQKQRGNNNSNHHWYIPEVEWKRYIQAANNPVGKLGIWLGFNFGLRVGEIVHLRLEDIDFDNKAIIICTHDKDKEKKQVAWNPKSKVMRKLPFIPKQEAVLTHLIKNIRPKDLDHPYLLWNPKNKDRLREDVFRKDCEVVNKRIKPKNSKKFSPHVLRRSFATHYYHKSNHNIFLISKLLGHSDVSITTTYLCLEEEEILSNGRALFSK